MPLLKESSVCSLAPKTVHLLKSAQVITSVTAIVKELSENALDAGTALLSVRLEKSGLQRVEVKDNGSGISEADLQQVCKPHTTSKLTCFSDLDNLQSYGFRGEALSSLCQVGNVTLTTRHTGSVKGHTCSYGPDGIVLSNKVAAANPGTTVTVSNLFHCLPVRRQYHGDPRRCKDQLKRIEELLMAYSLARPDLHVTLTHDKNIVYQKSPAPSVSQALHAVFPGVARGLTARTETEQQVIVTAHLPDRQSPQPASTLSRSSTDRLFLLVNGRPVHHKQIEKTIKAHYSGGSEGPHGRYPIGLVTITLPSDAVDVNLEPNKDKILFKDEGTVMKLLTKVLTDLYGPLATAANCEDSLVCSLASATQPLAGSGGAMTLPRDSSLSDHRKTGSSITDPSQNGGDRSNRADYDDEDDFFSESTGKENHSTNSSNFEDSAVQNGKIIVKNPALAKYITGDRGVKVVGKSNCERLKTGGSTALEDGSTNSTSLGQQRFLSSTPPLSQAFSTTNDPTFGSLSSIDILSIQDQTTLAEILSQDVNSSSQDQVQANYTKSQGGTAATATNHSIVDEAVAGVVNASHTDVDQERGGLIAQSSSAGGSSPSSFLDSLLTGTDQPIDPAAWSKGHVYAQDGTNIESVEVIGTSASTPRHLPRQRSRSPPIESPAKRQKLSHDYSVGSNSSAVAGIFSQRKLVPNSIPPSSERSREESSGATDIAATSNNHVSGSGSCDIVIERFCAPIPKAQRNLMLSQDHPCSPTTKHAFDKGGSFHHTTGSVATACSNTSSSNDCSTSTISTSNFTCTRNSNSSVSSVVPPSLDAASSSDPPTAVPREALGASRPRAPKESSGDRKARKTVLSVAGTEVHGGQLVRKPTTAFAAFAKDIRNTVLSENPGAEFTVVGREIASRWKALDTINRARYEDMAKDDADRYQKEVRQLRDSQFIASPSLHNVTLDRFVSQSVSSPAIKSEAPLKVKKEPSASKRPWMERSITVQTTVADIGRRLRQAAEKVQSTEDTSAGYKVVGKIRYPTANDVTGSCDESTKPLAASSPSVMCFVCLDPTRKRIMGLHGHGLQEVLLCYRLMERYSIPRRVLDEPLPFNASSLGEANWQALLRLDHQPAEKGAFRVVTDQRLTDNGLKVALYAGPQQPHSVTHGELQEVAASVAFFGLSDLQQVLKVLAKTPSAPLIQTRPVKLRHWIQGECVRMIRDTPALTSCHAVTEKLVLWQHYKDTYTTITTTADGDVTDGACSRDVAGDNSTTLHSQGSLLLGSRPNTNDTSSVMGIKEQTVRTDLNKANNVEDKKNAVECYTLDDSNVSVEDGQAKIAVLGLPDASVCLHHKPILHEFYDLDELPGSQSQRESQPSQDPMTLY